MNSEKSINSFKMKNCKLLDYLLNNSFVYYFVNKFPALLLCKINVLDFFDIGNFFRIFFITQNFKILIESNYWLRMYVPHILNLPQTL